MKIEEIYEYTEGIGVLVFSTIYNNEVHSRVAHFNGYDDEGIYFRTAHNKPFCRQLKKTGKVTVCGCTDTEIAESDDGMPIFQPGYSFRLIGEIKLVKSEVIKEKAKNNKMLEVAVRDMEKYPAMENGNFVINKAKVEIFDYSFESNDRDHKLLRTRTSFGGTSYNQAGPRITNECIGCGKCKNVCTFKAIEEGNPYSVVSKKCDDCGSCISICPVDAIELSLTF